MKKHLQNHLKAIKAGAMGLAVAALPVVSMAAEPDYSDIVGAADWTTVAAGIVTIYGAVSLVKVALKGGRMLLAAFR